MKRQAVSEIVRMTECGDRRSVSEPDYDVGAAPWSGRSGNLAYLAKMFPRISETFILREVMALRRCGIPVCIYSILPPTRDARMHPQARALLSEVTILPQSGLKELRTFLADLLACFTVRPGATLREFVRTVSRPRRRSWRRLIRAVSLAAILRRDHVAHLHAAWAHTPASVSRIASRLSGIPWSMGAHAKDIHLSSPDSLAKKIHSARFTAVCSRANHKLLSEISAPQEPGLAIPSVLLNYHGVDTDFFAPARDLVASHETESAIPLILSVGRLVEKKGFDTVLEASALLHARGVSFRLEIIGQGPLRALVKEKIGSLNLKTKVKLRGTLIFEEVREAYRRATCVTLACRVATDGDRDGIPNTLAEAMASGVPVVATRLPSVEELVKDGETGLLVPPDDPRALADALERVLRDPSLAQRLGMAAREWVCRNFDSTQWESKFAKRFTRTFGVERVLYLSADRGVPVRGDKGASVHVRSVTKAMGQLGVEVRLVTSRTGPKKGPDPCAPMVNAASGNTLRKLASQAARWFRGGVPLERALLRVADNVPLYLEARRQTRTWRPDMIYERYALTAIAGSLLARRLGIPHVLEVNAPLADEEDRFRELRIGFLAHWLERWVLRRADRVIVVSQSLADHARRLGTQPNRIVVLPNAIDPEIFHPRRDGRAVRTRLGLEQEFIVGFSGTLKPWHGLDHLLRAVAKAQAKGSDVHLLIMGDGPLRQELEDLAKELGSVPRVHFTGFVPHTEVGDYLAACDVLTAPYPPMDNHWFSPLKVAEYLAVGRPVVASAIGQLQERLSEGHGVVLVPPGDEDSLRGAIVRMAGDPDWREKLARYAAQASKWTWGDLVRKVLEEGEAARREIWGWQ